MRIMVLFRKKICFLGLSLGLGLHLFAEAPMERLEVTGSHIRRIDIEGPSPLVVIGKDDFTNAGHNTIEDVLKESAYIEEVTTHGTSGRQGYIRFHGQHAGNTLILLNGMRLPMEAGGFYTSVSYIPPSALEKIEIVKDGSAALYGADAMAGVMNFVTQKAQNVSNVTIKYNFSEIGLKDGSSVGLEKNYVGSVGRFSDTGSFLLVSQFRELSPYFESDLGSYVKDPSKYQGKRKVDSGVVGDHIVGKRCDDGACASHPFISNEAKGKSQDVGILVVGHRDWNDTLKLQVTGVYNHKKQRSISEPLSISFDVHRLSELCSLEEDEDCVESVKNFRSYDELGELVTERKSDTVILQVQLSQSLGETWEFKFQNSFSLQKVENTSLQGDAFSNLVAKSFAEGIWDIGGLALASARPIRKNKGNVFNSRLIASGDLVELNEGYLSMAVGVERNYETFEFVNSASVVNNKLLSSSAKNFEGNRKVLSLFTEFSLTPWDNLEVQIAGRFDDYGSIGDTLNPKVALSYRPVNWFMVRASYGSSFKLFGLSDEFTPNYKSNYSFYDYVRCPPSREGCSKQRIEGGYTVTRNRGVTFETSKHYNLGLLFQPLKNMTVTVDQWNFEGRGTISNFTGDMATEFELEKGSVKALKEFGVSIVRDESGNIISMTVPNVFNRESKTLRGIDFELRFNEKGNLWGRPVSFGVAETISYIFKRKEQTFSFTKEKTFDNFGTQNTIAGYLGTGPHYFRTSIRTLLDGSRSSAKEGWDFPVYTEYDLTYARDYKKYGKLTIGVKNFLNSQPPVDETRETVTFGETASIFSPLGRRMFLVYSLDL